MKEAIFYQILTILAGYAVYMEIQIFNEASSFEKMLIVFSVILVLILECLVLNYWNILISERIED
jgi:diacylglycerol kinase